MFENIHYRLCGLLAATVRVTISVHRPEVVRAVCLVRPHCTLSERLAVLAGAGCGRHPGGRCGQHHGAQRLLSGPSSQLRSGHTVGESGFRDGDGRNVYFPSNDDAKIITSTKPESRDACACEHVYSTFGTLDRREDFGR